MDNELYHYGILGMKWGIRRYQNKDGTLTSAGKKRYGVQDDNRDKETLRRIANAIKNDRATGKYKKWEELSDEEKLRRAKALDDENGKLWTKEKQKTSNAVKESHEEAKKNALKDAKEKDLWDMEFLEMVDNLAMQKWPGNQELNDNILADRNKDKLLELYKEYLNSDFFKEVYGFTHGNEDNGELYHYGILGMKWGIRRYQNKDGTLTAAGRKRYEKAQATLDELNGAKARSDEKDRQNMTPRQRVKEMTDEELARETTRLRNEKNYLDAVAAMTPPKRKTVGDVLKDAAIKEVEKLPGKLVDEGMKTLKKYMEDMNNEPKKLKEAAFKAEVSLMSDEALEKALQRAKNEKAYTNIKLNKADDKKKN